ncbi:MAG: hypothetical protein A2Y78_02475 [Acidobacteria bacterium RBG_13_68_16]|jgi:hypothetical protein|nr:MAG: hypothetical protein A2Y78_02475 [Acidobacteria bacterium RBG_13_68_16]
MTAPDEDELAYYRAVEDHFAALRGTPFLFSPKDFALLRKWWTEGVPLAGVLAGIGEIWERRREREADPVSSLSYCRHAVARQAKRLASARVGAASGEGAFDVAEAIRALARAVAETAAAWRGVPQVAAVLSDLERAVSTLPEDGQPAALDETLADLEFTSLDALLGALPVDRHEAIASDVERELAGLKLADDVRNRTRHALLVKALRRLIGLPRLELTVSAH